MMHGPGRNPLSQTILGFFYGYFILHWLTGVALFWKKLGFAAASVKRYYLGDPDLFMNPRSFEGLLEVTHFHLFAMGMFFVVFAHLVSFAPFRDSLKSLLVWTLAVTLLGELSAGWLIRYVSPMFVWLKLTSFWLLQTTSLVLFVGLLGEMLWRKKSINTSQ
jgi:hypothetical protein